MADDDPFIERKRRFLEEVEQHGFENTWFLWKCPGVCGCMGPRGGEPFCNCLMCSLTADMFGKVERIQ